MKIKTLNLFVSLFLSVVTVKAQSVQDTIEKPYWQEMMQEPNANYFKTKRAFDLYFSAHDEFAKGSGAKHFRRWEHRVVDRVDKNGNIIWFQGQLNDFAGSQGIPHNFNNFTGGIVAPAAPCPSSGHWQLVGPVVRPFNQSGQPNGTGRINTVEFHPTDTNTFYACSPQGGLWKSTNAGQSWTLIFGKNTGVNTIGVSCVALSYNNPDTMYLGSGDIDAGDAPGYGVLKSTNGGTTWTQITSGMGNVTVGRIIIDPNNSAILLASTTSGVYRSTNSGGSWSRTSSLTSKATDLIFKPTNSQIVYSCFSNGLFYKSTDNGLTWSQVTTGLPTTGIQRGQIAVTKADADYVYYVISQGSAFGGLYLSTNSGTSFSTQSTTPNILGYSDNGSTSGGQGWYDLDIEASPNDRDVIYVAGVNIWKSTNAGVNWTISGHWTGSSSDDVHADQHGLTFNASGSKLLNGNDGGVYITTNGGTIWDNINNNISNSQIYRMAQAQSSEFVTNHGYQDNGSAVTEKNESYTYYGGDGTDAIVDPTDHKYIYGAYVYGRIYRAYDKTNTTTVASNGVNGVNEQGAWVTPFVLQEGNPHRFFAGYRNIWRTDSVRNTSITMTKISNNLGGSNTQTYKYLESNPAKPAMLYALRNDNKLFRTSGANDSIPTWTDLTTNLPGSPRWVESHPTDSNIVYLCANTRVYRSTDKGSTWGSSASFSGVGQVKCAIFDTSAGAEVLYVGTEKGVYYLKFSGTTGSITDFNENFAIWSDVTDIDLFYHPKGKEFNHVVVSTYGRSVWRSPVYSPGANKPSANAYSFDSILSVGGTLKLFDKSIGAVSSRIWKLSPSSAFTYINGTDSTMVQPEIKVFTTGVLKVQLIVSNCQGSDTLKKHNWIKVFPISAAPSCTPTTTNWTVNWGIGILNFELNDNNSETGLYKHDDQYQNYSKDKIFRLLPNTSYTARIKSGLFNSTIVRLFIDYNNNGTFESSNSEIIGVTGSGIGYKTITFTTPTNLKKNQAILLRLRSDFGTPSSDPCANSSYGESEDYSIVYDYLKTYFHANKTTSCANANIIFTDTSQGLVGDYEWDFGAGAVPAKASGKGPHTVYYTTIGLKTVSLKLNGSNTEVKTNYINISGIGGTKAAIIKQFGNVNSCQNDSFNLKVTAPIALSGSQVYQWKLNNVDLLGKTDSVLRISKVQKTDVGKYTCVITDGSCPIPSDSFVLNVYNLPLVNYGGISNQCLKGNQFNFIDSTTTDIGNPITLRNWSFGPSGAISTLQNPVYKYNSANTFNVKLVISTTYGCKDSTTKVVIVFPQATLSPTVNTANQCLAGNNYSFTANASVSSGTISSILWQFGDGTNTSTINPPKVFTTSGAYSPRVISTTNNGCKDTATLSTIVYAMPKVNFAINDSTQCFNYHAAKITNTSTAGEGTITSQSWKFGDGTTSTIFAPTKKYTQFGNYTVAVSVTNSVSCTDSAKHSMVIYPSGVSSFTVNDSSQCLAGNSFVFSNTSSVPAGSLSYFWTYGDGSNSSATSGTKSYGSANNYNVNLVGTTNNNCKDTFSKNMLVNPSPVVSFTENDLTQCLKGNNYIFNNTSTGNNTYIWRFGDGTSATIASPTHTYSSEGNKSIKLYALTNKGCQDSVSKTAQVFPQSAVAFATNNTDQCLGTNSFNFTNNTPTAFGTNFNWNFGNGVTSIQRNGLLSYTAKGDYMVTLISSTIFSCKDTATQQVYVRDQPIPSFTINQDKQCLKGNTFVSTATSSSSDALTHIWVQESGMSSGSNSNMTYLSAGIKIVKLISTSSFGCKDSISQSHTVHPQTNISYDVNKPNQCLTGNQYVFTNTSSNTNTFTSTWNLGDGSQSSQVSPSKTYATYGQKEVTLYTNTDNNCKDTLAKSITLFASPVVSFTQNKTQDCFKGNKFLFNNTSSIPEGTNSYTWFNGNGQSTGTTNAQFTYLNHGSFTAKLVATSNQGCIDSMTQSIIVHPSPVASIISNKLMPICEGSDFTLTSTTSIGSGVFALNWAETDGKVNSGNTFSLNYITSGVRNVRLIATSLFACKDTANFNADIASIPAVNFTINPNPGCANQTKFQFTSTTSTTDNRTLNYSYRFNDGQISNTQNPIHTYNSTGNFNPVLVVSNGVCTDSASKPMTVLPRVTAAFTIDSLSFETKKFKAVETSTSYTYLWTMSNGAQSTERETTQLFGKNQSFTAQLIVSNGQNCQDTSTQGINIFSPNYFNQNNKLDFYIYPNPTPGKFTYKFSITEKRPVDVKLVTIDGRILWSRNWGIMEAGTYFETLNFLDLNVAEGTYPFIIKSEKDQEQLKVIFQK
jgi:PKD repeat protein/photosystem II stability/assembly factor-like uncharacterized protein